ncbi:hypothetical protein D4764_02G0002350 [Takifugu flavidus]|uniref:Uncharacterized protein n=1 Tax=Takifugu flavidus TaxID=433684 RepID=A0A5C6NI56_9TELE|nr:hypothetical protein D4764_02G0002350 [Takifugu flavidus]
MNRWSLGPSLTVMN